MEIRNNIESVDFYADADYRSFGFGIGVNDNDFEIEFVLVFMFWQLRMDLVRRNPRGWKEANKKMNN